MYLKIKISSKLRQTNYNIPDLHIYSKKNNLNVRNWFLKIGMFYVLTIKYVTAHTFFSPNMRGILKQKIKL